MMFKKNILMLTMGIACTPFQSLGVIKILPKEESTVLESNHYSVKKVVTILTALVSIFGLTWFIKGTRGNNRPKTQDLIQKAKGLLSQANSYAEENEIEQQQISNELNANCSAMGLPSAFTDLENQ